MSSSAHLCVRNVLTQAFRLPSSRLNAPCVTALPDFLVPALARNPRRRPFSSTKRRRADVEAQPTPQNAHQQNHTLLSKPRPRPISSKIPFPTRNSRGETEAWIAAIDPFLPPRLRRALSDDPDISSSVTSLDLAVVLNAAQTESLDILSYIGLVEERWTALAWIAKKLTEDGKAATVASDQLEPFIHHQWTEFNRISLDELTDTPIVIDRSSPSVRSGSTLDSLTSTPDTIVPRHRFINNAVGQLWRSMGELVLMAAERSEDETDTIMACVLEIIAHLHHKGLVPDSVYSQKRNEDGSALRQPPTLHLLSTQILTALSDAAWRAHEASVKAATKNAKAAYFLGHEIPGSRYKLKVTGLGPELWLELILWSCVHGGWLPDAAAILERTMSSERKPSWGLISWRELLHAQKEESEKTIGWGQFSLKQDNTAQPEDRARTRMTISSEVVTAVVDGLVNSMRLGIGARGNTPESIVKQLKNLKRFLDANSLSLGSTTWDAILPRLLESGGIVPDNRPEMLLDMLDLASAFGKEVNSINASPEEDSVVSEPPYFFEPTTMPLNLFHQALRSFIARGDLLGAMETLKITQRFTDINKERSLEQFFEALKNVSIHKDELFTHTLLPIEFPAFHSRIPPNLLAKLLDLATESKMYDVGRSLLFSDDLDGPLIHSGFYNNWAIGASIIRFGTMAGENDLVLKIVKAGGTGTVATATYRMPHELLTALFCSQIRLHRWKSIEGMQEYVLANPGYQVPPEILATFGAELLRCASTAGEEGPSGNNVVCHAFTDFLFKWEHLILSDRQNELYCILAILSCVSTEWKEYCGQFLAFPARQRIRLRTNDFNRILGGIVNSYGSLKSKEIVEKWCYTSPIVFEPYRAPGGLPQLPSIRESKSQEYNRQPDDIEVASPSGVSIILTGRIRPNRQTIRTIIQKVREEEDERRKQGGKVDPTDLEQTRETLRWSVQLLYYLGADYREAVRELGELAELAEGEAPLAPTS
ncbi:hypothetical protein DM02DRAFT_34660 [Periconia macrospinosa]|uniref:Uncharacterized protein n=1 Tax=Periconia macrospinosa TaxID=97972 RepID=A0A2V1E7J4_9PLEO|nr:hypothetical protein DM02DRAFT_34660 [Periconia macrospinosa]